MPIAPPRPTAVSVSRSDDMRRASNSERPSVARVPGEAAPTPAGPVPVIVLGGENNALSVVRSLVKEGIPTYALNQPAVPAMSSRYVRRIDTGRGNTPSDWLGYLTSSASDHLSGAVLMCCSDEAIKLVAENSKALSAKYILEPCPPQVRLQLLDKLTTYQTAEACGIPYPKFWRIGESASLDMVAAECRYPLVLKPRLSQDWLQLGAKYLRADNEDALRRQGARCSGLGVPIVVMEFVPGGDQFSTSYYSYLDDSGTPLFHFTKRNLRRYPVTSGGTTYHVTDWNPEVAELGLKLFRRAGLRGLGNVEFKRDMRDGSWKLIEVNARFTAGNALLTFAGIDLALLEYAQLTGASYSVPQSYRHGLTMWDPFHDFLAFRGLNKAGELTFAEWLKQARSADITADYRWSDPGPSLRSLALSAYAGGGAIRRKLPAKSGGIDLSEPKPEAMPTGDAPSPLQVNGHQIVPDSAQLVAIAIEAVGHRLYRFRSGRANSGVRHMWSQRVEFYQSMWRKACAEVGADLTIDGKGVITMRRGAHCLKARDHQTFVDSRMSILGSLDKVLVHKLLQKQGIPVPGHMVVGIGDFSRALVFMETAGGKLVVKPASQTGGGSGVTTNVSSASRLRSAMALARTYCRKILLEQQIAGDCYRLLFMDGELVDSILRLSPSVTGDGKSTVGELLRRENAERVRLGTKRSQVLIGFDDDVRNTIAEQGLEIGSVVEAGRSFKLKQAINENALQENIPSTDFLCTEIVDAARTAAELVGLRLAGVDVMTRDGRLPLRQTGGAVIEVNAPPNLYYHHLDGRGGSVATSILQAFFAGKLLAGAEVTL